MKFAYLFLSLFILVSCANDESILSQIDTVVGEDVTTNNKQEQKKSVYSDFVGGVDQLLESLKKDSAKTSMRSQCFLNNVLFSSLHIEDEKIFLEEHSSTMLMAKDEVKFSVRTEISHEENDNAAWGLARKVKKALAPKDHIRAEEMYEVLAYDSSSLDVGAISVLWRKLEDMNMLSVFLSFEIELDENYRTHIQVNKIIGVEDSLDPGIIVNDETAEIRKVEDGQIFIFDHRESGKSYILPELSKWEDLRELLLSGELKLLEIGSGIELVAKITRGIPFVEGENVAYDFSEESFQSRKEFLQKAGLGKLTKWNSWLKSNPECEKSEQ